MNKGSVAIQSAYLMYLLPPPHPPIMSSSPLYTKLVDGLVGSVECGWRVRFHELKADFRGHNVNGVLTGLLPSRVGRQEKVNRKADWSSTTQGNICPKREVESMLP